MDVDPEIQCFDCADQDEEPEDEEYFQLAHGLAKGFEDLVADVGKARDARRERMAFKSAAEMADEMVNSDRVALNDDERQQLGEWLPGDEYQGDVNMRTLDRLLKRVDQRGFERSAQQLEVPLRPRSRPRSLAHAVARARAVPPGLHARVRTRALPRGLGDAQARDHGQARLGPVQLGGSHFDSAPLWSAPPPTTLPKRDSLRARFAAKKTFSIAIFCACMALTFGATAHRTRYPQLKQRSALNTRRPRDRRILARAPRLAQAPGAGAH